MEAEPNTLFLPFADLRPLRVFAALRNPARTALAAIAVVVALAGGHPTLAAQAVRSPQARVVETESYRLHSELPPAVTNDLARELELCHDDYSHRLGSFSAPVAVGRFRAGHRDDAGDTRYDVHLFATEGGYGRATGEEVPNSAGLFSPGRRALFAHAEGQGRGELKATLRHEAFHQFAHDRLGPGLPTWVNEGLAQVFEFGVRVGDALEMGQVPPGPLREVQAAVRGGTLIDFADLLDMDGRRWAHGMGDQRRGALMYAQSWAMTHFLVYAAGEDGRPLYRPRFNAFLRDVAAGTPGRRAFERHFGTNLGGFRERFESYVNGLAVTEPARTADDQDVLALMLILLHHRGVSFDQPGEFHDYVRRHGFVLHRERNGVQWSTHADPGVYFLDNRGRSLGDRGLRFEPDPAGELPALVRRPGDGRVYRTRFARMNGALFHETTVERE